MEKERPNCSSHDASEDSFISSDGPKPKGFILALHDLNYEVERGMVHGGFDRYDRILSRTTIFSEHGEVIRADDGEFSGAIDSDVRIDVWGSDETIELLNGWVVPNGGYRIETITDNTNRSHEFHVFLFPRMDTHSHVQAENLIAEVEDEIFDEFLEDIKQTYPTCFINEEFMKYPIGDSLALYLSADGICINNSGGSQRYFSEELPLVEEVFIPTPVISKYTEYENDIYYDVYEFEVSLNSIFPCNEGESSELDTAIIGVRIAMNWTDLIFDLNKKIDNRELDEVLIRRYIDPYIQIEKL